MIKFTRSFLLVAICTLVLTGPTTFASGDRRLYKTFQCPAMHPEYTRMLDQIRALKQKVEDSAKCGALRGQIDSLAEYVQKNRENFVDSITKKRDEMLPVAESRELMNYANEASKRALVLIDLINGDEGCVEPETKSQLLTRSSSLVFEASNLLGMVAGPYGVPIAVGGALVAGVMKGVAQFFENQSGFDFDDFEQRQFYSEAVCQFYRFRVEAEELLDPQMTLEGLSTLAGHLEGKIQYNRSTCGACDRLFLYYTDPYNKSNTAVFSNEVEMLRVEANALTTRRLGNDTLEALRTLDWVAEQEGRFQQILRQERIAQGPRELLRESLVMSKFLYDEWADEYIEWYLDEAASEFRQFQKYIANWATEIWQDRVLRGESVPQRGSVSNVDFNFAFVESERGKSGSDKNYDSKWKRQEELARMAGLSIQVVDDYCGFFADILEYSDRVRWECEQPSVVRLRNKINTYTLGRKTAELGMGTESGELLDEDFQRSGGRSGLTSSRFEMDRSLEREQFDWVAALRQIIAREKR